MKLTQWDDFSVSITQDAKSIKELPVGVDSFSEQKKKSLLKSLVSQLLYLTLPYETWLSLYDIWLITFLFKDIGRKTPSSKGFTQKSFIYTKTNSSILDLVCYVDASYNKATEFGVHFNVRGSVQWKTAEIKRRCVSVKSAELFALNQGAGQLCHFKELYRHFSAKPIRLTLMTDSQTTMDSLRSVKPIIDRMNQHLLDNFKLTRRV